MDKRKTDTKQKITYAALDLFARKGYTDTGIREIARAVGVKEPSVYNHFKSKSAILEHILATFAEVREGYTVPEERLAGLTKDATVDDIMLCLILYFPEDNEQYYLQTLHVLFQEQCRNEKVRDFVVTTKLDWAEMYISEILNRLVNVGALDEDIDISFWARMHTNVTYMFTSRYVLGVGEMYPHYKGYGQEETLRKMYTEIFKKHGVRNREAGEA